MSPCLKEGTWVPTSRCSMNDCFETKRTSQSLRIIDGHYYDVLACSNGKSYTISAADFQKKWKGSVLSQNELKGPKTQKMDMGNGRNILLDGRA